jgi:hypothetical protein
MGSCSCNAARGALLREGFVVIKQTNIPHNLTALFLVVMGEPPPAWQDIVMDRAAWNKMLRNIYTN